MGKFLIIFAAFTAWSAWYRWDTLSESHQTSLLIFFGVSCVFIILLWLFLRAARNGLDPSRSDFYKENYDKRSRIIRSDDHMWTTKK